MRFPIEDKILECLRIVEYATIFNFQPYLSNKALNINNGLLWSTKIFNKLKKQKRIHPIGLYPYSGRTYGITLFIKLI